ncbi:uncharacterized protein K02A2.6-like [Papaver somniferum]|uniref:uncharacterized protein K02A2.6-like n=1 Tax=Papaver somniferum TaxID=3469 RepID=UPI000E6F9682|nr:uncharacterized protein K02A2.6-like [Papaver somniferum]
MDIEDWRLPYIRYLQAQELPEDKYQAGKISKNAWRYVLIKGELYKKPIAMEPYLRCVTPDIGKQLMVEAHEGCCGNHSSGRILAHKTLISGILLALHAKGRKGIRQEMCAMSTARPLLKTPENELHPVMSPWSFNMWGLDIVGPFPTVPGGVKYFLVATEYFTKWVKAVALVRTEAVHVRKFIWENILCRFGVPFTIISDNGKQFDSETVKSLCGGLHIKHNFSTPYYAQSNGKVEATNRVILDNLKRTLEKAKGRWTEFLPGVLWAYRTTPRRSTGFAPFTLAYGVEVVPPVELLVPTTKTLAQRSGQNSEILARDKELLEDVREEASRRLAIYQQSMKFQYNKKARERVFQPGEQL